MDYNLPQLIRIAYKDYVNNVKGNSKVILDLIEVTKAITFSKYKLDYDNKELVQQILGNLFNAFLNSQNDLASVWKKCINQNEENDKILTTYFYDIIKTAKNEISKDFFSTQGNRLYDVTKEICEELIEKNFLKSNNGFLCINTEVEKTAFDNKKFSFFANIINKEGTINRELLKQLITTLFSDELENYYLSPSSLVGIISDVTGVGDVTGISIDQEYHGEEGGNFSIVLHNPEIFSNPQMVAEINIIIEKWWRRLDTIYFDKGELELHAKIYLAINGLDLTLDETIKHLGLNVGKSSVDNYLKRFIRAIQINKDFTVNDDKLKYALDAFLIFINSKYHVI